MQLGDSHIKSKRNPKKTLNCHLYYNAIRFNRLTGIETGLVIEACCRFTCLLSIWKKRGCNFHKGFTMINVWNSPKTALNNMFKFQLLKWLKVDNLLIKIKK